MQSGDEGGASLPPGDHPAKRGVKARLSALAMDRQSLDRLAEDGLLDDDLYRKSLIWLHPPLAWAQWSALLLLGLGTALCLVGFVFFFAFNWASIPSMVKLGAIEFTVLFFALASVLLIGRRPIGPLLLLVASLMVGVFFAVFGQIYQTGADAWQFFALWASLILVWTLVSRSLIQWLLWLSVANLALLFWMVQTDLFWDNESLFCSLVFAGFNALFLLLREILAPKRQEKNQSDRFSPCWLAPLWPRWFLTTAIIAGLFLPAMSLFVEVPPTSCQVFWAGFAAILCLLALFLVYRWFLPDLLVLTLLGLVFCILVIIATWQYVDLFDHDEVYQILFITLVAISCFACSAAYLRHVWGKISNTDLESAPAGKGEDHE